MPDPKFLAQQPDADPDAPIAAAARSHLLGGGANSRSAANLLDGALEGGNDAEVSGGAGLRAKPKAAVSLSNSLEPPPALPGGAPVEAVKKKSKKQEEREAARAARDALAAQQQADADQQAEVEAVKDDENVYDPDRRPRPLRAFTRSLGSHCLDPSALRKFWNSQAPKSGEQMLYAMLFALPEQFVFNPTSTQAIQKKASFIWQSQYEPPMHEPLSDRYVTTPVLYDFAMSELVEFFPIPEQFDEVGGEAPMMSAEQFIDIMPKLVGKAELDAQIAAKEAAKIHAAQVANSINQQAQCVIA